MMKPPGGECHDLFGAAFNGSPSHLRVLKPPGGGSSDIFGAGNDSSAADARRIRAKQQQSSQLFLGSTSCSIASSSSNSSSASSTASDHVDSHSNGVVSAPTNGVPAKKMHGNSASASSYQRLFGEYQIPATPSKNHMKSSIVLDDTDSGCGSKSGSSHSSTPERGNSPRESTKTSPRGSPPLRNPVTGDGCGATGRRQQSARRRDGNPVTGEGYEGSISKPSTPLSNGSSNPPSTPSSTATGRQRVPPGGFSSGLW